ncbi:peptidyl-prolyl cis-trans isomerase G-like isoform X2 [Chelonus insularis]|uniref:peptidyl-prolyl cis-trans isomerase G-like isoform X2 n=1 Tax=Chelonus insularis TaxID=460826 RepID=UPI00158F497B|nr:peptidyl-prolyl cis-trans isomerase G-like isoform X2 [Chelonus insularis]
MTQLSISMKRGSDIRPNKSETPSYSRSMEEKMRRRREWMIEQEKAREHERRKQRMIQEYEERRARELGLKSRSRRSSCRSRSRSHSRNRSKSSDRSYRKHHHEKSTPKDIVMSEKYDSPSSRKKLFKGEASAEPLDRRIENPEEIKLIRREGEGTKPIFEREEIKEAESCTAKIEEHRKVVAVGSFKIPHSSRRRSTSSPSPRRYHHSKSPHRESRYRSRSEVEKDHHQSSKYERSSHNRSHEYRHHTPSREYDDNRHRSRDRDYDRRDSRTRRDSRERDRRMTIPHHYMEPVPVPIFYDNYMRPIMMNPMITLRNPVPIVRGRMPPLLPPMRPPFNPRLVHALPRQSGYSHPRVNRM